jgi:hypothetical protein
MLKPKVVLLIFVSGKIVLTGAKVTTLLLSHITTFFQHLSVRRLNLSPHRSGKRSIPHSTRYTPCCASFASRKRLELFGLEVVCHDPLTVVATMRIPVAGSKTFGGRGRCEGAEADVVHDASHPLRRPRPPFFFPFFSTPFLWSSGSCPYMDLSSSSSFFPSSSSSKHNIQSSLSVVVVSLSSSSSHMLIPCLIVPWSCTSQSSSPRNKYPYIVQYNIVFLPIRAVQLGLVQSRSKILAHAFSIERGSLAKVMAILLTATVCLRVSPLHYISPSALHQSRQKP